MYIIYLLTRSFLSPQLTMAMTATKTNILKNIDLDDKLILKIFSY